MDIPATLEAASNFSPSLLAVVVLVVGGALFVVWQALLVVKAAITRKDGRS